MGWNTESLLSSLRKNNVVSLKDESGAVIAAVIYHCVDQLTDEILFLATSPGRRKQGWMERLLREFAAAKGEAQIWLECREDNLGAIQLYKKIGFKESGRRERYYRDGTTAILFNF